MLPGFASSMRPHLVACRRWNWTGALVTMLAAFGCGHEPPRPTIEHAQVSDAPRPRRRAKPFPKSRWGYDFAEMHGQRIPDPFRWLENAASPETTAWVTAQSVLTEAYLEKETNRDAVLAELSKVAFLPSWGLPRSVGGRHFSLRTSAALQQNELVAATQLPGPFTTVLRAETLDPTGQSSLSDFTADPSGRLVAVGLITRGSDWRTWRIVHTKTRKVLPDVLTRMRLGTPAWSPDGRGLYFARFPDDGTAAASEGKNQTLVYHELGTPEEEDVVLLRDEERKGLRFSASVTPGGRFLVVTISAGVGGGHRVLVRRLGIRGTTFAPLVDGYENDFALVGSARGELWFRTTQGAPRGRVVGISITHPDRSGWREIVPERAETLANITRAGAGFAAVYLRDGAAVFRVLDARGHVLRTVPLPGPSTVHGLRGAPESGRVFATHSAPSFPSTLVRIDVHTGVVERIHQAPLPYDPQTIETFTERVASRDGTAVPVMRSAVRGAVSDGPRPTLLTGYGGFGRSLGPSFSALAWAWMQMGGAYVVAAVRGGGEYGEDWHRAGMRENKRNTFDDFLAVAEWLVANGHTRPEQLGIAGSSNGGLLVVATALQRPELFGAVLPDVGVFDMLRFDRMGSGWQWDHEYGSPGNARDFAVLRAYSPVHNVRPGLRWPPTLVTTGDNDDRVVPAHSYKLVAALQTDTDGSTPILLRVASGTGHGAGKSRAQRIAEMADRLAFLARALGLHEPPHQPEPDSQPPPDGEPPADASVSDGESSPDASVSDGAESDDGPPA